MEEELLHQNEQLVENLAKLQKQVNDLQFKIDAVIKPDFYIFQRTVRVGANSTKIGFLGSTPILQWSSAVGKQDINGDSGLAANRGTQYTGNTGIGTSAYSVGDIVAALKTYGLLA